MTVVIDFHGEPVKRRLLLIAASNLRFVVQTHEVDPWIVGVEIETADDAYRLGIEHGRLMIEEGLHANADTH